jgi:hypothetical protein
MKAENVSLMIDLICKELGIEYCSTNPHYVELVEDARKMGKMYLQLKEMTGILKEIEERHGTNLHYSFQSLIEEIDKADHVLIKLARELKDTNV